MAVIHATEDTFKTDIETGVVLVDFWAEWCAPCKMISPILDEVANEYGEKVKVVKVDIEKDREVANQLGIMSIPTLFVYVNGEKKEESVGYQTKEKIDDLLKGYL